MAKLDDFGAWLVTSRAVTEQTAESYVAEVRRAWEEDDPPFGRLRRRSLAPKTRRKLLAAARQWAVFTENARLIRKLTKEEPVVRRLPAGVRQGQRAPFSLDEWDRMLAALDELDCAKEIASVIGMMATRGFRVGDVLRLKRSEVLEATKTGRLRFTGKGEKRLEFDVVPCKAYIDQLAKETAGWSRVADLLCPSAVAPDVAARRLVWRWCRVLGKKAKVGDCYTHRFRRTVATAYIRKLEGDPLALFKLKRWMGWSATSTAEQYIDHLSEDEINLPGRTLRRN